jgi:hypothetical protein
MILWSQQALRAARLPAYPFSVNHSLPVSKGLVSVVAPVGPVAVDVVRPRAVTTAGTRVDIPTGPAIRDFNLAAASATELDFTSGPYSVAAWLYLTAGISSNKFPTIFAKRVYVNESNNQGWELAATNSGTPRFSFRSFRNNGSASYALDAGTPAAGLWFIVGTSDGTTRRLYITDTSTVPLLLGLAWNRELSAREILQLYSNPYAFLLPSLPLAHFSPVPLTTHYFDSILAADVFGPNVGEGFLAADVRGFNNVESFLAADVFGDGREVAVLSSDVETESATSSMLSAEVEDVRESVALVSADVEGGDGVQVFVDTVSEDLR